MLFRYHPSHMLSLLLRIAAAGFLSLSSLLVILFRVSPISSPKVAIPTFFLSLFLAVASFSSLGLYAIWHRISIEGMDLGSKMNIALREGIFLASAVCFLVLFQLLSIFTWWIGLLILLIFLLVELALHY
jgi:hypothetical protein